MTEALQQHALQAFLACAETDNGAANSVAVRTGLSFINLRGDAQDAALQEAVQSVIGVALPLTANTFNANANVIYWLGPDEWLIQSSTPGVELMQELKHALSGSSGTVVDVSNGNVLLQMTGGNVRDILAKGSTLNLSPAAFTDGDCAQTGISHTSVLLANTNDVINIIVRRSFAEYLALWLQHAGAELGIRFE